MSTKVRVHEEKTGALGLTASGPARRIVLVGVWLLGAMAGSAQTFEVLHEFRFEGQPYGTLLIASDGFFYGTTQFGGTVGAGTIFRADTAGNVTTLHSFSVSDGQRPQAALFQAADGLLYGTTTAGGAAGFGTIFRCDLSGNVELLHSFAGGPAEGSFAFGGLVQGADGNLYGLTAVGGANQLGTAYRLSSSGGMFTTIHIFSGADGVGPSGELTDGGDGNLYGVTGGGGAHGLGTVFAMDTSGAVTVIHSFNQTDGLLPGATLVHASDGLFYGSTAGGGTGGAGTVFKVSSAGSLTTLHSFAGTGQGSWPQGKLVSGSDGFFYGTTVTGGVNGRGTLYQIDSTGNFTWLHTFSITEGASAFSGLVEASDGNLYGTTVGDGLQNNGAIFRSTFGGAVTAVHAFGWVDGVKPRGRLVLASDGNLYGATQLGGAAGLGSVFRISPGGTFTSIHEFASSATEGQDPSQGLIEGSDGFLYGNTLYGGPNGWGTVFRMDTDGSLLTLHSFDSTDGSFPTSLVQSAGGTFFGTTSQGGAHDAGTVFSMDDLGTVTTIHDFSGSGSEGSQPYGRLVEGSGGVLFGTTYAGGDAGFGTVYSVDASGNFTTLHGLAGSPSEGAYVLAGLVIGSDGYLYGATQAGGANGKGTVFKLDTTGSNFESLHHFNGTDGTFIYGEVIPGTDGNLYGTAFSGGSAGAGTLFRLTTSGTLTTLFNLSIAQGGLPFGGLIAGPDGALYGTGVLGGSGFGGIVFRYGGGAAAGLVSVTPTSGAAAGGVPLILDGSNFLSGAAVLVGGLPATNVVVTSATRIDALTPTLPAGTLNDVAVQNVGSAAGSVSATLEKAFFADFLDVPQDDIFHAFVEQVFRTGITAGCGGGNYCRNNPVTRAQMAVLLLKAEHGAAYDPPDCAGIFPDVPCTPGSGFSDWIEQLAAEEITSGCGGGNYCPGNPVTRQQMAVFLLKTKHGSTYLPPDCTDVFEDVPCPGTFTAWVEQLYAEGVTGGCSTTPLLYCPASSVTRGQMAVFLMRAFELL